MKVWHHASALQPCKCPICRRLITLLVPTEVSTEQHNEIEARRLKESIAHYNCLFGEESRSFMQVLLLFCYLDDFIFFITYYMHFRGD